MRQSVLAIISVVTGFVAIPARAQSDVSAEAETLFRDARNLIEQKDYVHACPKLAESYRLDPATGALHNLAACNEALGKTATAWAQYGDVVSRSSLEGNAKRAELALARQAALEPKLSKLTISVSAEVAATPGIVVKRDGLAVEAPAWNEAFPVDPGQHVVEASAPGKVGWTTRLTLKGDADKQSIELPALVDLPPGAPVPAAVSARASSTAAVAATATTVPAESPRSEASPVTVADRSPRKRYTDTSALVTGSVGVAALAAGGIVWLVSNNRFNQTKDQCNSAVGCAPDFRSSGIDQVSTLDKWAAGLAIAGGVAVVAAGALHFGATHRDEERLTGFAVDPVDHTLLFQGRF